VKQTLTTGIILSRTNYGEADRILTILTPDHGKLRLVARGVRKVKSKLAGGIELFSTSHITFIEGRGELGTLISTRLIKHYGHIAQDLARVQLGYELIRTLNRATEDYPEPEYFKLLEQAFAALNDSAVSLELIRVWFQAQLLRLAGHTPNLKNDAGGQKLDADKLYNFDLDSMAFTSSQNGRFMADHIKTMRLLFSLHNPNDISQVQGLNSLISDLNPLIQALPHD
jgi:DNA repair protein RecO (recombination protein O)